MSSERFDTEPPREHGVSGGCALVRGGSTTSNHLEPPRTAPLQGQQGMRSPRFDNAEPSRTAP